METNKQSIAENNSVVESAKDRVIKEYNALNEKIINLMKFMSCPKYKDLNKAEYYLLLKQFDAMTEYLRALEARLAIWREI